MFSKILKKKPIWLICLQQTHRLCTHCGPNFVWKMVLIFPVLACYGSTPGWVLPQILDRGVPRRFLNPNPI